MNIIHSTLMMSVYLIQAKHSIFLEGVLYLGPDSILPAASFIAMAIGFLLIFWRLIIKKIKRLFQLVRHHLTGAPIVETAVVELPKEESDKPVTQG